jgi:shikimate kinase
MGRTPEISLRLKATLRDGSTIARTPSDYSLINENTRRLMANRIPKEIRKLREERDYWYMRARMDSASLSRTLSKVREIEENLMKAQEKPTEKSIEKSVLCDGGGKA